MRFKFRAFYKRTNEMLHTEKVESINFETKTIGVYMEMDGRGFHRLRLSDFEVMQWTGLKDKNGMDIYEGDIVRLRRDIGVIRYDESRYLIDWKAPVSFGLRSELWYSYEGSEVVGNIYENPELIGRMASDSTEILSESEAE